MSAAWGVLPYTTSKHASLGLTKNSGEFLRSAGGEYDLCCSGEGRGAC